MNIPATPAIVTEIKGLAFQLESNETQRSAVESRLAARSAYADALPSESSERQELQQKNRNDEQTLTALAASVKALTAEMEGKKSAMGVEVLELIRAVNADLRDLLESPGIRSDPEVMESTLNDAISHLSQASSLYAYVRKVQTKGLVAAVADAPVPDSPKPATESAVETDKAAGTATASASTMAARPEDGVPLELSGYHLRNRHGQSLLDFSKRYKEPLAALLAAMDFDVSALTDFLKERGLNGGSLQMDHVLNLLRNAGIRTTSGTQAKKGPVRPAPKKMVCRARGVHAVCEVVPTGFKVKAGSVGLARTIASYPERMQKLRDSLIEKNVARISGDRLLVRRDYVFSSLSTAAGFLTGSTTGGIAAWKEAASDEAAEQASARSH